MLIWYMRSGHWINGLTSGSSVEPYDQIKLILKNTHIMYYKIKTKMHYTLFKFDQF
jgi:hypothetical protein